MNRFSNSILFASAVAVIHLASTQVNATNPAGTSSASSDVQKILSAELKSDAASINRREALHPAEQAETASDSSWWQSGFVKLGSEWRAAELSDRDTNSQLIDEYQQQRVSAPKTAEGQLKLANWCESHKLKDQERAHLLRVLMLSGQKGDPAAIYRRLGYQRVGQSWVSPFDYEAMVTRRQKDAEAIRHWQPVMERIVRNWSGNAKQRKLAQAELDGIQDSSASTPLVVSSSTNESLASAICECLNKIESFESSQALAAIAVQSDWPKVRAKAIEVLKKRRINDFVPMILESLSTPVTSTGPTGNLATGGEQRLIFREEKDRFVAIDLRVTSATAAVGSFNYSVTRRLGNRGDVLDGLLLAKRVINDTARESSDVDHELQLRMDAANNRTEEINTRASAVLAAVSGQDPTSNPLVWWAWWHYYTGTMPYPKNCVVFREQAVLPTTYRQIPPLHHSCLIAGTPIWTEHGFMPVEQIQIGDRVLAKDVESGELTYKPVLQTTERQPVAVKKMIVDGVPIVSNDGHHFWSSGTGWIKTREIKSNLPIHTLTGMSRVESIEYEPQPAPVYNLVVADFHTYFVGSCMILSHDVTPPVPTNVKVPGLINVKN